MEYNQVHEGVSGAAHDLHDGLEPSYEGAGQYVTDLYTSKAEQVIGTHNASTPLFLYVAFQAPHMDLQEPPAAYMSQYSGRGRVYQAGLRQDRHATYRAAAVTALDTGVGRIVDALRTAGMYDNSVIVFTTDNGGVVEGSSNFPLRGRKDTLYEGGVRGVAWVHSPLLCRSSITTSKLMYITDWFSTLLSVAGLTSLAPPGIDSFNMWTALSRGKSSPRKEIVFNLDQDNYWGTWSAAIRMGPYKLLWGQHKLLKTQVGLVSSL